MSMRYKIKEELKQLLKENLSLDLSIAERELREMGYNEVIIKLWLDGRRRLLGKFMNKIKEEYSQLLVSGMFWEFFPQLSGDWEEDEGEFTDFYIDRENNE